MFLYYSRIRFHLIVRGHYLHCIESWHCVQKQTNNKQYFCNTFIEEQRSREHVDY